MTMHSKQEARGIIQGRLQSLPQAEFMRSSDAVRNNARTVLVHLINDGRLKTVLSYRAVAAWCEADLSPLEHSFKDVRFDHVASDPRAPIPTVPYDAILVPLYGFDTQGYRLGHGGGWYDRFLVTQPDAYKIGIGFDAGLVHFIRELHDIPMNYIVTESGIKGSK